MWWHTHTQKQDFIFRRNRRVQLNRRGASVQSTTGSRGVRISGSNAGYTMFRGGVKGIGYPLYLPVSPSLPLPCITVCHHVSTGLYHISFLSRSRDFFVLCTTHDGCDAYPFCPVGIWGSSFLFSYEAINPMSYFSLLHGTWDTWWHS